MKKKEEANNKYTKKEVINIKEFMLLSNKEQDKLIEETLGKVYENDFEIEKKYIEKCLNIAFDNKDNETYLPHSLCVAKEGNKLTFSFKKTNKGLLFLFFLGFLFMAGFATYTGVYYIAKEKLNVDTDGDGVADLNIDIDDDGICDINCDTDGDGIADTNIDYQGSRVAVFNVLMDDGSIFNATNQDIDGDGVCDLNCDVDGDGHPDTNIDLDGDGIADINIDVDGDGTPDLNIDTNGDGVADINVDTDGDGVCDSNCVSNLVQNTRGELNVDTDGDGVCDINCDTDNDGIPDENIDYGNNKEATFNVVDEDGNITNKTNQDTNGDGVCDSNCDIDGDGWPDVNIDLDGDGVADLNIDINNDGTPDLNIDTDADGEADMNIDTDGDGVCDSNCTYATTTSSTNGQVTTGDNSLNIDTASLVVVFDSGNDVSITDLYPDDQDDDSVTTTVPDITFTITNQTDETLYYNLSWINVKNTFTSGNFWVKISSNNSGYTLGWKSAPTSSGTIASRVSIAANTTQSYTVSFTLHGTGEAQDEDQGKYFAGQISVELIDE